MKRERVLICIPAHDCKVSVPTCQSLMFSIAAGSRIHAINMQFECGNSIIARARNKLVAEFMAGGYDQLFFIDSDLGWQPDAFVRFIQYPEEIVCGVYPYRYDEAHEAGKWPLKWGVEDGAEIAANEHGLLEVQAAPTGFMRIRRSAIEKLIAANPDKLVQCPQTVNGWYYALFNNDVRNGKFTGEDYYFCDLWRQIGGKIWIDPNIGFEHMGVKSWRGNLSSTLIAHGSETSEQSSAA